MKKIFVLILILCSWPGIAAVSNAKVAENFVNQVKKSADGETSISASIAIECPAPSASGTLLITKASYEFEKSNGVYIFKNGPKQEAILHWIEPENPDDDFMSDVVTGMGFGFTVPRGQVFITIMKNGKVKVGVNRNEQSGIKEINCKAVDTD